MNLPGAKITIPGLTAKDLQDLNFGLQLGVDVIAVSFVRTPEDVYAVRGAMMRFAPERRPLPVIAKMERPEALQNLEGIVEAADGVMVAHGDLGVEMLPETVPIVRSASSRSPTATIKSSSLPPRCWIR